MQTFWELLRESVIVQAIVTLALVIAYIALAVRGVAIPDGLHSLTILALGFYFGSKTGTASTTAYRDSIKVLSDSIACQKAGTQDANG